MTVTGAAAAIVVVGGASAATAAPGDLIPLTCDNGQHYTVQVNGNGEFTPGRIVGSTGVLVPSVIGPLHFHGVGPNGQVVFDETEPAAVKGNGGTGRQPTVTCTFSVTMVEEGTTVTFSGIVTGFITGRR